jgi:hypothetical protein
MEAIKFKLNFSFEVFFGKLIVQLILPLHTRPLDLFVSMQAGELPIHDTTLLLVPQQQIVTFELFDSDLPHPFLDRHCLVVIFEDLLAHDVADGVDDLEEVVDELVLALDLADGAPVASLPSSLDEGFN